MGEIKELVDQERVEQDALLDFAIAEAVSGWKQSQKEKRKAIKTAKEGIDPRFGNEYSENIETLETEEQAGDPRFLKVLIETSTRKSKLWGLDAAPKPPAQIEDTTPDPQGVKPWEALASVIQQSKELLLGKSTEAEESDASR